MADVWLCWVMCGCDATLTETTLEFASGLSVVESRTLSVQMPVEHTSLQLYWHFPRMFNKTMCQTLPRLCDTCLIVMFDRWMFELCINSCENNSHPFYRCKTTYYYWESLNCTIVCNLWDHLHDMASWNAGKLHVIMFCSGLVQKTSWGICL